MAPKEFLINAGLIALTTLLGGSALWAVFRYFRG
jgi:hypothetical protein